MNGDGVPKTLSRQNQETSEKLREHWTKRKMARPKRKMLPGGKHCPIRPELAPGLHAADFGHGECCQHAKANGRRRSAIARCTARAR
jgi:hypothetical protein